MKMNSVANNQDNEKKDELENETNSEVISISEVSTGLVI